MRGLRIATMLALESAADNVVDAMKVWEKGYGKDHPIYQRLSALYGECLECGIASGTCPDKAVS